MTFSREMWIHGDGITVADLAKLLTEFPDAKVLGNIRLQFGEWPDNGVVAPLTQEEQTADSFIRSAKELGYPVPPHVIALRDRAAVKYAANRAESSRRIEVEEVDAKRIRQILGRP